MGILCENSIRDILKMWKREAGAKAPIQFKLQRRVVTIYTWQVGYLIGKAGMLWHKYVDEIHKQFGDDVEVVFEETAYYII